jgi:hypothetical protein
MIDKAWTWFVRAWREVMREHHRRWLDSPARLQTIVAAHPLPWVIERDWTWEVIAQDGTCVAKKRTHEDAAAFVAIAEGLSA